MMKSHEPSTGQRTARAAAGAVLGLGVMSAALLAGGAAGAAPADGGYGTQEVDQTLLVPTTLDSSFAPFDCRMAPTGPVCTGERHLEEDWVQVDDFGCELPLFDKFVVDRYQTRYYDHDNLNYFRQFRTHNVDYFALDPSGPPTASITTHARFTEDFAVRGDDRTMTITTSGVLWDVRPTNGAPVLRITGTLVEPYDGPATLTGHRVLNGDSTHYDDAPLDDVLPWETFASAVCQAAVG